MSHLRTGELHLRDLLLDGDVLCHSFVVGELACGNLRNRTEILSLLQALPLAKVAEHEEILQFIVLHDLMGICIGLVDVHLLAAALLSRTPLWTLDKHLRAASISLGINYR